MISRRSALAGLALLSTCVLAADETSQSAPDPAAAIRLAANPQPGELTKVHAIVEVDGQLKLNPDGKQVKKLPFKGTGEYVYQERLVTAAAENVPAIHVRHYQQADAGFQVGEEKIASKLADDRRLIGVKTSDSQSVLFSPLGPLTKDELELVDIQGLTTVYSRLLPGGEVSVGNTWTLTNETAAILLRLDVLTENKLTVELKKVEKGIAYAEITGTASGSVGGVVSDLEVTAKFNFDESQQRVTWLAMSIQENRAIGHAEPGFEVTARIRVEVQPLASSEELADSIVSTLPLTGDDASTYLRYRVADGALELVLPRAWRVMIDRHDVTVMRFVDRGEMIAQCNISKLTDAAPGKQLAMESFQQDIQRSLSKNFNQFVEAKEFKTQSGLRGLRVVVAGAASELPIQWIYYHLTDQHGQQAAMVFTFDGKLIERFGAEDQTVVEACEFTAPKKEKTQATAKKTSADETGDVSKR